MKKIRHDYTWEDYEYWQTQDKKMPKKINSLLKDIERNGELSEIGKPEALIRLFKTDIILSVYLLPPGRMDAKASVKAYR